MYSAGKNFVFVKASEGLTGPDDAAMANNIARAEAAGLLAGVYHYAHPENRANTEGAIQEADHFLSYAGSAIGPGHLRPALDIEGSAAKLTRWSGPSGTTKIRETPSRWEAIGVQTASRSATAAAR